MNANKFKALVHYIIDECSDQPDRLGAIRLNKALWFSDVIMYQSEGAPITEETYVKRQFGPVPRHILATLRELAMDGVIAIKEPEFAYDTRVFHSMRSPDPDILGEGEKRLARAVLDGLLGQTASVVSEISHDVVWDAAPEGEDIPLYATLVAQPGAITPDMIEWAKQVASEHGVA